MIETRYGNVLDVPKGIIVHGCNCLGVMGSGIAKEVKDRFPKVFEVYKEQERDVGLKLGNTTYVEVSDDKFIVNALTQRVFNPHPADYPDGRYTSYDAVYDAFYKVRALAHHLNIHRPDNGPFEVLFPKIGAVRGGGDWEVIQAIIDRVIPDSVARKVYYEFVPPGGI